MPAATSQICALCRRKVSRLTRHHLIPRTRHKNPKNKRDFDRATVKQIVLLCRPCHREIHALFTEKELERHFRTVAALRAHPDVATFINWLRTKPDGTTVPVRRSRGSRRS